ncbi:MAG: choice-of-anchor D domain-containing protein [Bacteroidota bacterium]
MHKCTTTIARYLLALIFILSLGSSTTAVAQRSEINDGKEFYFGIPHCRITPGETARGGSAIQLWVSSKVKTKVTVKADGIGYTQIVNVDPNIVKVVPLNDALMNKVNETPADNGITVTSEEPISLTVLVSYKRSGEAFKVIPVEALGKKYYTLSMYQDQSGADYKPGQILITATSNNTAVTYYPTAQTEKVAAGASKNIILQKGQTYLIEGKIKTGLASHQQKPTDLSGTYIVASKPISVIAGHTKGSFPRYKATMLGSAADFMRNMLIDVMWPVEFLGTEYISAPVKYNNRPYTSADADQRGDLIRFVATEDGTQISQMRADGSGLKPISMFLNKGQFYDIVEQEIAAYYKSNKPVLVGQYGKAWRSTNVSVPEKGDNIDVTLNPSRNGSGMLMTLTPMAQWGSNAVFRSVEEIDNFTLIIYKTNEIDSIEFDGMPMRMAFDGLYKVEGTPYSYARKQVGSGDHNFKGSSNKIKFATYAYGNYDYQKDGFAYGYPTSVNYAISCEDSLKVEATPICGDYTGKATAYPKDAECAAIYNAYMIVDKSKNYSFSLSAPLEPGLKEIGFELKVIDKTQEATAFVKVISRSGLDTTLEFNYYPQQVIAEPNTLDFAVLALNQKRCAQLTLKNPGKVDAIITNLTIKSGATNFTIDKSQLPITIKPGQTAQVEVCAIAVENASIRIDSVIADLECFRKGIAVVKYSLSEAQVVIGDAPFGRGLIGRNKTLPVTIENKGTSRVEVYSVDIPAGSNFMTNNLLDKFPIILEAGQIHTFNVTYTPVLDNQGNPQKDELRAIFKANTEDVKLFSDWTGEGIDVIPVGQGQDWERQRVIDEYVKTKLNITEWPGTVNFKAIWKNAPITIKDIKIIDDVKNVFRIDQTKVDGYLTKEIDPKNSSDIITIPVFFAPNEVGPFSAKVVLLGTTTDEWNTPPQERNDTVTLTGIGIQPAYTADDKDFGTVDLNSPTPGTVRVYSTGTTELKITGMTIEGADAANFTIDPSFRNGLPVSFADPIQIIENDYVDIPVIFTATTARKHNAQIVYESDAPVQDVSNLMGNAVSGDISSTPYDFPATYITQTNTNGIVECVSKSNDPIEVKSIAFENGNDNAYFTITGYKLKNAGTTFTALPITIPGNDVLQVSVSFTPNTVRNDYKAEVKYETSLGEVYSKITGIGKDMTSTVKIARNYEVSVGSSVPVTFDLKGSPDAVNDGNITSFKATVNFAPTAIQPREGKENIRLTNMTTGWEVVSAQVTDRNAGVFEVVMMTNDASKALKGEGSLFEFTIDGYLDMVKESELPCQMTEFNRPWVTIKNEPGLIKINPVCGGDLRLISLSTTAYQLMVPSPNPVSGDMATIRYAIGLDGYTRLVMVDANGQLVANLVNENQVTGTYEITVDVSKLATGKYFYHLESGPFTQTEHMMISK